VGTPQSYTYICDNDRLKIFRAQNFDIMLYVHLGNCDTTQLFGIEVLLYSHLSKQIIIIYIYFVYYNNHAKDPRGQCTV